MRKELIMLLSSPTSFRAGLVLALACAAGFSVCRSAAAQSYTYTTIDPLGARFAEVASINASGQTVGIYQDPSGPQYGFLTGTGGANPITIDPFGSTNVYIDGINAAGQVVGGYNDPASDNTYGFFTEANGIGATKIDPFGARFAAVNGINDAGQIIGFYDDPASGNQYGFLTGANGVGLTEIDPFGSTYVDVRGVNAAGQVVGSYIDPASGNEYGFFGTPAAVPEASTTVSFGLLLMLGLGGMVFAAKKRKSASANA